MRSVTAGPQGGSRCSPDLDREDDEESSGGLDFPLGSVHLGGCGRLPEGMATEEGRWFVWRHALRRGQIRPRRRRPGRSDARSRAPALAPVGPAQLVGAFRDDAMGDVLSQLAVGAEDRPDTAQAGHARSEFLRVNHQALEA